MKLSIIVPLYNVEKLMRRCIDSILAQQLDDFELLLVDDGSTDGSGEVADTYAANDCRVRVFHKENGGPSEARNLALRHAQGEYLMFVDGDDEIMENTIPLLIAKAEADKSIDILEFPVLERPYTATQHLFTPGEHDFTDCMDWLEMYGTEHSWVWNKIYRKDFWGDTRFESGKIFEDVIMLKQLLLKHPHIATTDKGMYLYHWNEQGIVSQSTKKSLKPLLEAQISLVRELGIDTHERRWHRLYANMFTIQLYVYRQTGEIMLKGQRLEVKRYNSRNDMIKAAALNILGMKKACQLFKWIYKE